MSSHRAVHVQFTGGPLQLVDVDTRRGGATRCASPSRRAASAAPTGAFVNGGFPPMSWPLTPGHEIAGAIAEIGDGVEVFTVGNRVTVGWFGGQCTKCIPLSQGSVHPL